MTTCLLKMKTAVYGLMAMLMVTAGAGPLAATEAAKESASIIESEQPAVEVVFVLDTTGSMGGLIAAAKEKIWSIANTLATANPAPNIKMGLVGYRDRGDGYVTTVTPLSDDLDAVYTQLMQYRANGGGDGPESVNQALYEAVVKPEWSSRAGVYRVIFLVGDAPPHMDYHDDVKYTESCRMATRRGIIINTIQCGNVPGTALVWRKIARLAEGSYFQVAQSGSAVLYDTPYDEKIAALSSALDDTRIYYGDAGQVARMEDRKREAETIYEAAAPSAVAKRAIFNSSKAGAKNFLGSKELVDDILSGRVKLDAVKEVELPDKLKAMNKSERQAYVAAQGENRQALQKQIEDLAGRRQHYIEEKVKLEGDNGTGSLDAKIYQCIQAQAADKNILYTHGPAY
jgi:Mg-chelatase subunit ChlD